MRQGLDLPMPDLEILPAIYMIGGFHERFSSKITPKKGDFFKVDHLVTINFNI